MRRWRVFGVDRQTGKELVLEVTAESEEDAAKIAGVSMLIERIIPLPEMPRIPVAVKATPPEEPLPYPKSPQRVRAGRVDLLSGEVIIAEFGTEILVTSARLFFGTRVYAVASISWAQVQSRQEPVNGAWVLTFFASIISGFLALGLVSTSLLQAIGAALSCAGFAWLTTKIWTRPPPVYGAVIQTNGATTDGVWFLPARQAERVVAAISEAMALNRR